MHDLSSHASYLFFIEILLVKKNVSYQLKDESLPSSVTEIILVGPFLCLGRSFFFTADQELLILAMGKRNLCQR